MASADRKPGVKGSLADMVQVISGKIADPVL
jgi:hypothetical protein